MRPHLFAVQLHGLTSLLVVGLVAFLCTHVTSLFDTSLAGARVLPVLGDLHNTPIVINLRRNSRSVSTGWASCSVVY